VAFSSGKAFAYAVGTGSTGQVLFDTAASASEDSALAIGADLLATVAGPLAAGFLGLSPGFLSVFTEEFDGYGTEVRTCAQDLYAGTGSAGSGYGWPAFGDSQFGLFSVNGANAVYLGDPAVDKMTPDNVYCDPALVFPALYSPSQIDQEPWQGEFCAQMEVLDGAGEFPPAVGTPESVVAGTSWGWIYQSGLPLSGVQETSWLDAACPPSWLTEVFGSAYTDNVAGFSPASVASGSLSNGVPDADGNAVVCDEQYYAEDENAYANSNGYYDGVSVGCNYGVPAGLTVSSVSLAAIPGDNAFVLSPSDASGLSYSSSSVSYLTATWDSSAQSFQLQFYGGNYGGPYQGLTGCGTIYITYSDGTQVQGGCEGPGSFTETDSASVTGYLPAPAFPLEYFPGGSPDQVAAGSSSTTLAAAPDASPAVAQAPHAPPAGVAIGTGDSTAAPAGQLSAEQAPAQSGVTDVSDAPDTDTLTSALSDVGNAIDTTARWGFDQVDNGLTGLSQDLSLDFGDLESVTVGALTTLGQSVDVLVDDVLSLPSLVADGILSDLEDAFEPSTTTLTDVQSDMTSTFPLDWVATGVSGVGDVTSAAGTALSGSACGPYVGWSGLDVPSFGVNLPSPDASCPGNGPGGARTVEDDKAGDLYGYRTDIRDALALFMILAFIVRLSRSAPWVADADDLSPQVDTPS
jgi:hypothetical protein